jgi:hypothetical protein
MAREKPAPRGPFLSLLTPVWRNPKALARTARSVAQLKPAGAVEWLVASDDEAADDARVAVGGAGRVVSCPAGGDRAAHLVALIAQARTEWVAVVRSGDELEARTPAVLRAALDREPDVDVLYTDELVLRRGPVAGGGERPGWLGGSGVAEWDGADAGRSGPEGLARSDGGASGGKTWVRLAKPEWDVDLQRGLDVCGDLVVLRRAAVLKEGGPRGRFGPAAWFDLVLRLTERNGAYHIPEVLYRRRVARRLSGAAWTGRVAAVRDQLERLWIEADASRGPEPGLVQVDYRLPAGTAVSVIVPVDGWVATVWGGRRVDVRDQVRALLDGAGGADLEVVVVAGQETPEEALRELDALDERVRVVRPTDPDGGAADAGGTPGPHGRSSGAAAAWAAGLQAARGEIVILMGGGVLPVSRDFVARLAAPLVSDPGVGVTGCRLLDEDGTPAATVTGAEAIRIDGVSHEVTALDGACVVAKRALWERAAGGDVCQAAQCLGLRVLWLAEPVAYRLAPPAAVPAAPATPPAAPKRGRFAQHLHARLPRFGRRGR